METFSSSQPKKRNLIDTYFLKIHRLKASDSFIFRGVLLVFAIFFSLFLIEQSMGFTVSIATSGGTFTEGIVGTPRFVNPVLAVTRADKDLTTLVYDGIMSLSEHGTLEPNIAESVTISEDGLTYNIILRKDIFFHDGVSLTSEDIAFTVSRIQEPQLGSPLRANFGGIQVEVVGEHEINFILPEPYAPFIENLTFGILPSHIWKEAGTEEFPFSQYNSEPIGSGPYKVREIIRNASGIPEKYILGPHTAYHLGSPKIETFEVHFFPTEERLILAFKKGVIESVVGVNPVNLLSYGVRTETHHIEQIQLPRTFALFINQNKSPALRDTSARQALNMVIDRDALVTEVLKGYGSPLTSPIPPGFGIDTPSSEPQEIPAIDRARDILKKGGWKLNQETQIWEKDIDGTVTPLAFSIATANSSTFESTATFLANSWKQLGVEVTIKQFEQSDLTQAVIRPRDYEALLFGSQLGRALDYYSFWHSSQRNDPGLNVSLYANITTDSILAEMRRNTDSEKRTEAIQSFTEELLSESPAFFLYAPKLVYIVPNEITGMAFTGISDPHERFARVNEWYIKTESVWPFFKNNN